MKITFLISMCLMLTVGCEKRRDPKVVNRIPCGKILDADVIPTSFNEHMKMTVKTEKSIIVIYGLTTIPIGEAAEIVELEDGRKLFTHSGRDEGWLIRY